MLLGSERGGTMSLILIGLENLRELSAGCKGFQFLATRGKVLLFDKYDQINLNIAKKIACNPNQPLNLKL
jgi:hypothetical protein